MAELKHETSREQTRSKKVSKPHFERELFVVALLVLGSSFSNIISQQDAVHFALTWSLVNTHAPWLNGTMYAGQPYVIESGGHLVSSLPPGLAFFGFAFVAPAQVILPMEPSVAAAYLATYFACVVGALACVVFFRLAKMFGSVRSSLLLTLVFTFGTSMWLYSRIYLPEGLATLLGISSVYFAMRSSRSSEEDNTPPKRTVYLSFYLSGILLGLAVFVDNMAAFLVVPIAIYITLHRESIIDGIKSRAARLPVFIAGLMVGSIPIWYYDAITTGNIFSAPYGLPIIGGVPPSAYENGGLIQGLYQLILSPQSGLLLFTPFVIFSVVGTLTVILAKKDEKLRGPTFLFAGLFLSILLPFSLQSQSTYLHNTIGPAELVLAMPFALLPSLYVLDRFGETNRGKIAIYSLAAVSILINGIIALTDPVSLGYLISGGSGSSASPFLTTNLPLFLGQSYLTWWSFFAQPVLYACAILLFPLVVLLIYAVSAPQTNLGKALNLKEMAIEPIVTRQRTQEPRQQQQEKQVKA